MPEVANLVDEKPGPFLGGWLVVRGNEDDVFEHAELGALFNPTGVHRAPALDTSARSMLLSAAEKDDRIHTRRRRRMFHHQVDCRLEPGPKDAPLKNEYYVAIGDPLELPPVFRERFNPWLHVNSRRSSRT